MLVSVIIVSYNTIGKLRRCLSSIHPDFQVIVVDNASGDGSPEMVAQEFPFVVLVRNAQNVGFGAANNQGLKLATHPLVLFVNSDAYPFPDAIQILAKTFDNREIVAAGPKLLNLDDSLQQSTANHLSLWAVFCEQFYLEKLFPNSRWLNPYWNTSRLALSSTPQLTSQVMGACLMCRKDLESFDERYFLYCEDTDLCLRLERHGKIVYVPEAKVYHELGSSSSHSRWKSVARYNAGKELFFEIHHGRGSRLTCWILNRVGALLRLTLWGGASLLSLLLVKRTVNQVHLFWKVAFAPLEGPTRS